MDPATQSTAEHCNFTAFIFVPNVCNAACEFCYVHPSFATSAIASPPVLSRAKIAAEALHRLGFEEVRFTGGEPTVFSNLDAVVEPFLNNGLRYRVLTNGINIGAHLPFFRQYPPARFTISVHDTADPADIFKVPINPAEWARDRHRLAEIAEVEATLVVDDSLGALTQADATLTDLAQDGVAHIKLILENSRQTAEAQSFSELGAHLAATWKTRFHSIRYSDTRQLTCRLPEKAFPAIDLGRGKIFACCVQVGDRELPSGYSGDLGANGTIAAQNMTSIIEHSEHARPGVLPCDPGTDFCPLGLTK